ncbi:MAG: hypothetical protein KDA79_11350, partial [Planctomycetaceae bacterium]|nr:hypothetical protein [Planctomycetaceae bacterium]
QTTGQILGEFFQLPETLIDQVLRQQAQTRPPPSPEEQEQLRQKLRGFSELRGRELIRHLLTYDELRKRSDIWEIHLSPGGLVEFRSNGIVRRFRAETIEEFAFGMFATYKSLPEPKGLVILLMSYGDILVGQRRAAMAGLPIVTDRMRRDSGGRTRFEYAVLGFEPDRPPLE